jgi:hypothetical protein
MRHPDDYDYKIGDVFRELYDLRRANRELRRNLDAARSSRDRWRAEARAWKWGFMHPRGGLSTVSPDLSPTERAEASGVG